MATPRRVRGNIERLPSWHYRAIVYAGVDPLTGRERRLKNGYGPVLARATGTRRARATLGMEG